MILQASPFNGPVLRSFSVVGLKYALRWRGGRVAECGGLENRYPEGSGSGVRIPPSPPPAVAQSAMAWCHAEALKEQRRTVFAKLIKNLNLGVLVTP